MARRVLSHLTATRWAMTEEGLRTLFAIASRGISDRTLAKAIRQARPGAAVEAVQAIEGREVEGSQGLTIRNGIATITMIGPMIRYATFFSRISGATSIELLARDVQHALADPSVRGILLACDSEGGEVNGTQEAAEILYQARGVKPIRAHISGDGCSAAHWIVSAAERIAAGPTAIVGSIGVRAAFVDASAWEQKQGIETIEFVSSQSPRKAVDPTSPDGRQAIQKILDDLAEVFIQTEARNRSVSVETVLADYGQGGVFVGAEARTAGLVDDIATYEETHADFEAQVSGRRVVLMPGAQSAGTPATALHSEPEPAANGAAVADAGDPALEPPAAPTPEPAPEPPTPDPLPEPDPEEAARTAERERLAGLDALLRPGAEAIIARAKADPTVTPAMAAHEILLAENAGRKQRLTALAGDVATDPPPAAAATGDPIEPGSAKGLLATLHRVNQERATARRTP